MYLRSEVFMINNVLYKRFESTACAKHCAVVSCLPSIGPWLSLPLPLGGILTYILSNPALKVIFFPFYVDSPLPNNSKDLFIYLLSYSFFYFCFVHSFSWSFILLIYYKSASPTHKILANSLFKDSYFFLNWSIEVF